MTARPRIVIIGGGFGGLYAARALRDAPAAFGEFSAGTHVRTPHDLLWHMTGVVGYARTMLHGGTFVPPRLPTFAHEITRPGE